MTEQLEQQQSFPAPTCKLFKLSGGRTLAYNIFFDDDGDDESSSTSTNLHPVLYIHGTPSSGLEGSFCASQVNKAGGRLYAVDRPGFGYSDPFPMELMGNDVDPDSRLEYICESMWALIDHLKWTTFSIIGVSGGGLYTLGMLDSYLRRHQQLQEGQHLAKLEAISIVAGVYGPCGPEGMMKSNQSLVKAVDGNRTWILGTMLAIPTIMTKILPESIMLKLFPTSEMPKPDQDTMADPMVARQFYAVICHALRQGPSWAAPLDVSLCFAAKHERLEESLKSFFRNSSCDAKSSDDSSDFLPRISIFHGKQDANVPVSHGIYVHEQLLQKHSKLHLYDDHGHVSIIGSVGDDFARAAIPTTVTTKTDSLSTS